MGRFPQAVGQRGSLKWIQRAVNDPAGALDDLILQSLPSASRITWLSPLGSDDYAEYRDAAFLAKLELGHLADELAAFWPAHGPQWDALARTDSGEILLIEAKAHVGELCSPGSKAGAESLARIRSSLDLTGHALGAEPLARWEIAFYQLANRLAHLHFLHLHGVDVRLILVNFIGDADMGGPASAEAWRAAYSVVWHVMGIPRRHRLSAQIIEVFPDVGA